MSELLCTTQRWKRNVVVSQAALDWMRKLRGGHELASELMTAHARGMPRLISTGKEYTTGRRAGARYLWMTTRCDWGGRLVTRVTVSKGA